MATNLARTRRILRNSVLACIVYGFSAIPALAWSPLAVADDPLLRMPGTQPDQGVTLFGPTEFPPTVNNPGPCLGCHGGQPPTVSTSCRSTGRAR